MSEFENTPGNPYADKPVMATQTVESKTSTMAVLSMVFGFLSLIFTCITGLIGLILGVIALIKINGSNGRLKGAPFAIVGIVCSIALSMFSLLFVAMLLPAVQQVREAARRTMTSNNLRQISLAQLNYETLHRRFPGEGIGSDAEGSGLSWRVHLLPFLEHDELYSRFNLNEPWDSPTNKALIPEMPEIYASMGGRGGDLLQPGETLYLRPIGGGAWPDPRNPDYQPLTIDAIGDGVSNTITVVEADLSEAVIWTKPDGDYYFDPNDPTRGLGGQRIGVTVASFVDGSAHAMPNDAPPKDYKAMFTINGGEDFTHPAYR